MHRIVGTARCTQQQQYAVHRGEYGRTTLTVTGTSPLFVDWPGGAFWRELSQANPDALVDWWTRAQWDPPGIFRLDNGVTPAGEDRDAGVRRCGVHLITPESEMSTHYFYAAVRNYRLGDTPWALILTYPTFLIPFCTWLMMGYFKAVPKELEECARIDGASRWQAMLYIVIPVAIPGILSAGIFAFTLSWNEFIYALVFLSSPEHKTVPVGVTSELIRGDVFFWGPLMAGALLGSIPVAIAYSFFVEHYVAGLTGSVKG